MFGFRKLEMSTIWNPDGTTQTTNGNGRGWGGGQQHHSIFGWADEKAETPVSESHFQSSRTVTSEQHDRPAAGVATKKEADPDRKVAENKLKDIAGHNIFNAGEIPESKSSHVNEKRIKEMQGSGIFSNISDEGERKDVSALKAKELQGNTGIFGDDGSAERGEKATAPSLRVSQPAGGKSSITFG